MFVSKTAISDGAASKLPTLSTYLNAVLIETVAIDTKDGSPRTRPIRILTGDEMALACASASSCGSPGKLEDLAGEIV